MNQKLHHRRPQTVGGFKKCLEEQGQTHELAAAGIVKTSAMRAGNHFTFIFFRFTSFVATLDTEKQRETKRKTSWETKWETRELGDKGNTASGRRTQHPTKGHKKEDELGDKLGDKPGKHGGPGFGKADTPSNKGKQEGVQWETRGDKTSGRRTHHPTKGSKKEDKL